ncbi:alpha/beta hydrolase [Sphingobium ummariense]
MHITEFYIGDEYPMYVQRWSLSAQADGGEPIILVHGGAHTGVFWSGRPDGGEGWAPYLARNGRTVYVVDWPGVGRSPQTDDFLTVGPGPCVKAIVELVRQLGPSILVGHSIGGAIGVKIVDEAADLISAFVAIAPAAPGIRDSGLPPSPTTAPVRFPEPAIRQFFTNADRFPKDCADQYHRYLCDLSPSIFNVVASKGEDHALHVSDLARLRSVPSLVIAGDQDQLVQEEMSLFVADFLHAKHVMIGRDWGLPGFGHMIPIETGSEAVADKMLEWLASDGIGALPS